MWIVQLALRRPYTFIVLALLILLATPFVLLRTPTDIFPDIDIPVVSIIWNYNGLPASEMADRIVSVSERGLTTTVNDIEHVESTALNGIAIVKLFFQPGANVQQAIAQVVSSTQAQTRQMPPGITPPLVIRYSASSIPILQLGLSSATRLAVDCCGSWVAFGVNGTFARSRVEAHVRRKAAHPDAR